jgi:hypothetical protein
MFPALSFFVLVSHAWSWHAKRHPAYQGDDFCISPLEDEFAARHACMSDECPAGTQQAVTISLGQVVTFW